MRSIQALTVEESYRLQAEPYIFDAKIVGKINLGEAAGVRSIKFTGCEIQHLHINSNQNYDCNIILDNCKLSGELVLFIPKGSFHLTNCTLDAGLRVKSRQGELHIDNLKITGRLDLSGGFRDVKIFSTQFGEIEKCSFYMTGGYHGEGVYIGDSSLAVPVFANCLFGAPMVFKNVELRNPSNKSEVGFRSCEFSAITLMKCVFNGRFNFTGNKIKSDVSFTNCSFKGESRVSFKSVRFPGSAIFDYSAWDNVDFTHSQFHQPASFKGASFNYLKISKADINMGADFLEADVRNADRESFRVIKNEFLRLNNNVEALMYKAKELVAYEMELPIRGHFWEKVLLRLNRISNLHGSSWITGVRFTILVSVIFYTIFLVTLRDLPFQSSATSTSFWHAFGQATSFYIKFLYVTHDIDFMNQYGPRAISYVVDFLGRVFIGFGIYQTVQAFRKHGKS